MEVELAGDQEDHGLDRVDASEASGATLGGLEQAIESVEEAIGLAGVRPGHDALKVTSHEGGHLFHRLDLAAHDAGAPVLEHLAHDKPRAPRPESQEEEVEKVMFTEGGSL